MRRTRDISRAVALALLVAGLAGCRQDMHNQPKFKGFRQNVFFADQRSARPLVEGVVARGHLDDDPAFYKGVGSSGPLATNPLPIDSAVLARGQERFNIYCTPCHDRTGSGEGMIVQRGYKQPPSFHEDRLRAMPDGYFFQVMTNGFGTMPTYRTQVSPRDRWAIVAYIRALQLSQHATLADVPDADRAALGSGQ
jgi:mono/diheme cytochrome c family protein